MKTTMTITVPTETAGELACFTIEFLKSRFEEVLEIIDLLVKPSDVVIAEQMGEWRIV